MKRIGFGLIAVALAFSTSAVCRAQAAGQPQAPPSVTVTEETDWYYRPAPERAAQPSFAQQKAMRRGEERTQRLEAMRWYGFSNSRPTASAMPFTSMYSPAWQRPGGRPFAWYMSSRPIVVYSRPYVLYR